MWQGKHAQQSPQEKPDRLLETHFLFVIRLYKGI